MPIRGPNPTPIDKCYEFGGKECVIRAWACDAKG